MGCLNPRKVVREGRELTVRCHKCASCLGDRRRDYVGRCLAEAETATGCLMATVTYGHDLRYGAKVSKPGAVVLQYTDVQKWFKRLRKAGYSFRYVAAGETGSKKGRCHWHVLFFFYGRVPSIDGYTRADGTVVYNDEYWRDEDGPIGITHWTSVNHKAIAYVTKYVTKDQSEKNGQTMFRMSRKPLLGAGFFIDWAQRLVEERLPLGSRYYQVGGSIDHNTGKPWNYYMSDTVVSFVVDWYLTLWRDRWGGHPPVSQLVERHQDSLAKARLTELSKPVARGSRPPFGPDCGGSVVFDERLNAWVAHTPTGRLYWSFDAFGLPAWAPGLVSPDEAAWLRGHGEPRPPGAKYPAREFWEKPVWPDPERAPGEPAIGAHAKASQPWRRGKRGR